MRAMSTRLLFPGVRVKELERKEMERQDELARIREAAWKERAQRRLGAPAIPPAGIGSREARVLDVRRLAFASAIKHGTKLSALADVFVDLVHEEECLIAQVEEGAA